MRYHYRDVSKKASRPRYKKKLSHR